MSDESKVKTTFIRPVNRTMSYEDRRGYVCVSICMYPWHDSCKPFAHFVSCKQHNVTFLATRSPASTFCLVCDVRPLTLNVAMASSDETLFPICPRKCNIIINVSIVFANIEYTLVDLMRNGCVSVEDDSAVVDSYFVCFPSLVVFDWAISWSTFNSWSTFRIRLVLHEIPWSTKDVRRNACDIFRV